MKQVTVKTDIIYLNGLSSPVASAGSVKIPMAMIKTKTFAEVRCGLAGEQSKGMNRMQTLMSYHI